MGLDFDFVIDKTTLFPTINDPSSIDLSIIVPAYNEETRLPSMLKETIDFLEERRNRDPSYQYEIIVVDDGSKDKTSEVALAHGKELLVGTLRVLTLGNKPLQTLSLVKILIYIPVLWFLNNTINSKSYS